MSIAEYETIFGGRITIVSLMEKHIKSMIENGTIGFVSPDKKSKYQKYFSIKQ